MLNRYFLAPLAAFALLAVPRLARAQNVGIGTTQPTTTLDVNGNLRVRGAAGAGARLLQADATGTVSPAATSLPASAPVAPALAATVTGLNNPLVAASTAGAVVLNRGASPISLSVYDVSAPAAPALRGTYTGAGLPSVNTGGYGTPLAASGTVAAVFTNTSPYTVSVFTLGPGAPALASTIALPAATSGLFAGVAMTGNLLFVTSDQSGGGQGYFYVYDVSNPAAPVLRNGTAGTTGFFTPCAIAAAGSLVCVSAPYGNTARADHFNVLDVSNPAAPVVVGAYGGNSASNFPNNPRPIAMSPGLLVELQPEQNTLTAYDLATPGAPALRGTYTFAAGTTPVGVALVGTLAYVACAGTNTLQVIDVSTATPTLRGTAPLDATAQSVAATSALVLAANRVAANDLQVFNQPTRTVVVYPDGTVASAPAPGPDDFIQNQTSTTQTGGFKVSGAGSVGTTLAVGTTATIGGAATIGGTATVGGNASIAGTATVGAASAPGQVRTPITGAHNMLAVAYGQLGGSTNALYATSGNYLVARTGTGTYTITFTAASGLGIVSLDSYPIVMSTYGRPGFVSWSASTTNGVINVSTYNVAGTVTDNVFNFVVYQP
jgi:hypothetical protein